MNICLTLNETTLIFGELFGKWRPSLENLAPCGSPTYIRSNSGGSLPPYIFIVIEFILHVPTYFIRFADHKKVHILSIIFAGFNVAIVTVSSSLSVYLFN